MKLTTDEKQDKEIFRTIFAEHWDNFKDKHPSTIVLNTKNQYKKCSIAAKSLVDTASIFACNVVVIFVVFALAAKAAFVFRAQKSMQIIW